MRTFSLLGLLCLAGCAGGLGADTTAQDGGTPCFVPTVLAVHALPAGGAVGALFQLDLGEVAPGLDPVVLASVHVGPVRGVIEGARLSVPGESGTEDLVLAAGTASPEGLALVPARAAVDLRALASGGPLPLRLELAGAAFAGPQSVTLDVCVTRLVPHGVF